MFISVTKRKKWVPPKNISFWIKSVINHVYESASEEDCRLVRVKACKVRKIVLHCCSR